MSAISRPPKMVQTARLSSLLLLLMGIGCGGPARVDAPKWNVSQAVKDAFQTYDRDTNGKLSADEASPGLREAFAATDSNKDGALSTEELTARLDLYVKSQVGSQDFSGTVNFSGRPLDGATVTFVPEKFLGESGKEAQGTTDAQGRFALQSTGSSLPGARLGIYLIRVEKKNASGAESVPAKYNSATQLGAEIGTDIRSNFTLNLTP